MHVEGIACEKCGWKKHSISVGPTEDTKKQTGNLTCLRCGTMTNFISLDIELAFVGDNDTYIITSDDGKQATIVPRTDLERFLYEMVEEWIKRAGGKAPNF